MIYNPYFIPFLPPNCDKPPTLYSILNAIVNGDKEDEDDYTKIRDLAKEGRYKIFDFDYTLSNLISKEEFETMILNHYMTRRIGFDTVTNFKLHLQVKINTIMPKYNLLFDNLEHVLEDEKIERSGTDNVQSSSNQTSTNTNTTNTSSQSTNDNRFSDTPQGRLEDVKNGDYVTDYTYNQSNGSNSASSQGSANSNGTGSNARTYSETIIKNNVGIDFYKIQKEMNNIYDMIFSELDCLFYSLV